MDAALPSLVWVIVDDAPRHVSDFAHLPPRRRPPAHCPQCGRRLTLKLGNVRRHHAAHDAGQTCPATQPETALHINCKLALATALRAVAGPDAELSIVRHCAGAGGEVCDESMLSPWLSAWDAVDVEHTVGSGRRPDIVLRRNGTPAGAIEVLVSNAVSAEKALALETIAIPWIEVRADERLMNVECWTPSEPLPVEQMSGDRAWRCRIHAARHTVLVAAGEERRAAEREAERQSVVLRAARVVDLYHAGGGRERFIYRVTELRVDGRLREVRLHRGGAAVLVMPATTPGEAKSVAWPALRVAFTADVERFTQRDGSFADSPMRWAVGDAAENIVDEALTDRAGRDPTPLATRYPRRWFYAKDTARWFQPPDMRDVRWDRAPLDAFAAHPAWSRAHSAVRERPAPEGSWSTPVFASRPVATMFRECVRSVTRSDEAIALVELSSVPATRRRAIVVVERGVGDSAIESVATRLEAESVEALWLSHPSDWCRALAPLVWAPAGRDWRGRGGVVIDGLGIYRADQMARAWAKGDRRINAESVRRHTRERVRRMMDGHER